MCGVVLTHDEVAEVKTSRELAAMLSHNNHLGYCAVDKLRRIGVAIPQQYLNRIGMSRGAFRGKSGPKRGH